jgi:hypothetical protein
MLALLTGRRSSSLAVLMERSSDAKLPPAVHAAAFVLHVDSVTAEVVTAMRAAGIRTLVLKGPSIAAWLYGDGAARPYIDSDLLVASGSYRQAGDLLRGLGFRPLEYSWHRDSQSWRRHSDASSVDLHRSLVGALAPPDTVWRELAVRTDTLRVGGIEVEVLGIPARALHVALHAAQHGVDVPHPLEDLARALGLGDEHVWREAADLARRIEALPAFAAGLRLDAEGVRVANRLGLPAKRPPKVALSAGRKIPVAIALESLASERSVRARTRLVLGALVPSPLYMRHWSAMHMTRWPAALRRGRPGLGMAYLWRPIWILLRLPKAIAALRRARRGQAQAES